MDADATPFQRSTDFLCHNDGCFGNNFGRLRIVIDASRALGRES